MKMAEVRAMLDKYGDKPVPRYVVCRAKQLNCFFILDRTVRKRAKGTPTFDTKTEGYQYLDLTEVQIS
jgi:hypothetical protein